MTHPTLFPTISRPQLAVLCSLHALLGCAPEADIMAHLEGTTRYTRTTGTYIVAELVALNYCWREGSMVGLSEATCKYLEDNQLTL